MEKRERNILILTIIFLLLLAAIIYFLFFFKWPGSALPPVVKPPVKQTTNQTTLPPNSTSTPIVKEAQVPATPTAKPATDEEMSRFTLMKMAAAFAERLGSYSNQGNYANIIDLKIQMTASMQKWADNYIATQKKTSPYSGSYQGITTHTINSEVKSFDSSKAEVLVHTQRVESGSATSSPAYNQDASISFVKDGGQWKVDNAKWINK